MIEHKRRGLNFINGSHGFLGSSLVNKIGEENVIRGGRNGYISPDSDAVFSIAAFGNLASQRKDAKEIYKANLWRVFTEMEHLPEEARYVYVSSSSVARPTQNLYSLSKRAAEEYLQLQDKKIAIMRPYSITGVGDQSEHLIPTLIRSCLTGEEMPFVPDPHHDFIDVEDVANALMTIRDKAQFKGEIYQVGRGKSYSNQEVLEMVENATGQKANIRLVDSLREYDTDSWVSDNTAIWSLGWQVTKPLERTIEEMVKEMLL